MKERVKLQNIVTDRDGLSRHSCEDGWESFCTYLNCLQTGRWMRYTGACGFRLYLEIKGRASVELVDMCSDSPEGAAVTYETGGDGISELELDIPVVYDKLVGFKIRLAGSAELLGGFYTAEADEDSIRDIDISLVTTTFKKREFIEKNIELIKSRVLCEGSDLKGHMYVHVIDNDRELPPDELETCDIRVYMNDNAGGSGGYARGMMEALGRDKRPTHILLMDDDVSVMPESLFRTYYLLRLLKKEYRDCFLSGAMFDLDDRMMQYEDVGCVHPEDGSYGPVKPYMDMSRTESILANEDFAADGRNTYAGWWYCCIPVRHIEEKGLPLPLFVRGDDVEFSLRNKPGFITLNGICIWHAGFAGKFNAAMELYQVHRNSLIIQAAGGVCRDIDFVGRINSCFWQAVTRFAYGNAELLLDSLEDYLKGPDYIMQLDGEACMREKCSANEVMRPLAELGYTDTSDMHPYSEKTLGGAGRLLYKLTVNGHLLPAFALKRTPGIIAYDWFFSSGRNFRYRTLVAVNLSNETGVVRHMDRRRCFLLIRRWRRVMLRYRREHEKIDEAYRQAFAEMTSESFWRRYLHI